MTQYTVPDSIPVTDTSDSIAGSAENLRLRLNGISAATQQGLSSIRQGITSGDATTLQAAKDDATTKANAAKWDKGVLATDFDAVQSSGRWAVNATSVPNMPISIAGELRVAWGATTGVQEYTTREISPKVYYRRYSGGAWGAWNQGSLGARLDTVETNVAEVGLRIAATTAPLDLISNGSFRDGFTGWTNTTGWVVESGAATSWARTVSGSAASLQQQIVVPLWLLGKTLRVKVRSMTTSTGTLFTRVTTINGNTDASHPLATGPYVEKTLDVVIPSGQGATPITVNAGRFSGNVYMTDIRVEKV